MFLFFRAKKKIWLADKFGKNIQNLGKMSTNPQRKTTVASAITAPARKSVENKALLLAGSRRPSSEALLEAALQKPALNTAASASSVKSNKSATNKPGSNTNNSNANSAQASPSKIAAAKSEAQAPITVETLDGSSDANKSANKNEVIVDIEQITTARQQQHLQTNRTYNDGGTYDDDENTNNKQTRRKKKQQDEQEEAQGTSFLQRALTFIGLKSKDATQEEVLPSDLLEYFASKSLCK